MKAYTYAAHVAYFDPWTGQGLLIAPSPDRDVSDPLSAGQSLHASDWDTAVRHLASLGIQPQGDDEDSYGCAQLAGFTRDGREALALYGPAILSCPSMEELAASHVLLAELAGLA